MAAETYLCPTCGSEVEVGGACPGCVPMGKPRRNKRRKVAAGKKKRAWEQDAIYDGLGVPDDEFDYEGFIEREFGKKPHRKVGLKWYWWVTGAVLLAAMGWAVLGGLF